MCDLTTCPLEDLQVLIFLHHKLKKTDNFEKNNNHIFYVLL